MTEAEAWADYLAEVKTANEVRYEEIEAWAWARLGRRLLQLERERNQTREAVAA